MNIQTTLIACAVLAAGLVSGSAHATLQGRDLNGSVDSAEAYYDTDLNITWLADANVNGQMNWGDANTWAANLSIVDAVNSITYDNWRLPTTLQPDASCGGWTPSGYYGCTGSEMGHMFYSELGGTADHSILSSDDPDLVKFTNIQRFLYWSDTEYTLDTTLAWYFYMGYGNQNTTSKNNPGSMYAWAVSSGDVGVAVAVVPEPEIYAMLLAGLGLVGAAAKRRRG